MCIARWLKATELVLFAPLVITAGLSFAPKLLRYSGKEYDTAIHDLVMYASM